MFPLSLFSKSPPQSDQPGSEALTKGGRRRFTPEHEMRILKEAEECANWELGSLWRRQGLHSSHLSEWRRQREAARFVQTLIAETRRQGIARRQLTLHADRSVPWLLSPCLMLMADLGVDVSQPRPRLFNDNPLSKAQFKAAKYRPGHPDLIGSLLAARVRAALPLLPLPRAMAGTLRLSDTIHAQGLSRMW